MTQSRKSLWLRSLALVFSSTLVVACQGGGGGSSKQAPQTSDDTMTTAPSSDSGSTDTADSGDQTNTDDSASAPVMEENTSSDTSGGQGTATLRWQQPTRNTDGSTLRDLVGYKVSYGLSPSTYNNTLALGLEDVSCDQDANDVRVCSYTVTGLSTASWYFAVQATDMDGNNSAYSNETVITVQ